MKEFLTIFFLIFSIQSYGQNDTLQIGDHYFDKVSESGRLTIYRTVCENISSYQLISKLLIHHDSITQKGFLSAYQYDSGFHCAKEINDSTLKQIISLIGRQSGNSKIGILFSMLDTKNEFVGVLYLFQSNQFRKFVRKACEITANNYSDENIPVRQFDYDKYGQGFLLVKIENKLSLISVH